MRKFYRITAVVGLFGIVVFTILDALVVMGHIQLPWDHTMRRGAWGWFIQGTVVPGVAVSAVVVPLLWRWTRPRNKELPRREPPAL